MGQGCLQAKKRLDTEGLKSDLRGHLDAEAPCPILGGSFQDLDTWLISPIYMP